MTSDSTVRIEQVTQAVLTRWLGQPGPLLPILHGIQDEVGYIPEAAIPAIAQALQQTRADIHGVISFYEDFRTQPTGRHRLQICRAEACQARGCAQIENHTQQKLGVGYGQTTADGEITLAAVYCLGNCATGPSVRVGDRIIGRVTPARIDRLIDELITVPLHIQPVMKSGQPDDDDQRVIVADG